MFKIKLNHGLHLHLHTESSQYGAPGPYKCGCEFISQQQQTTTLTSRGIAAVAASSRQDNETSGGCVCLIDNYTHRSVGPIPLQAATNSSFQNRSYGSISVQCMHAFYSMAIVERECVSVVYHVPPTYLGYFRWYTITQHLSVEALLGHVVGQATGPLERILQPLQFHISDYSDIKEGEEDDKEEKEKGRKQNHYKRWLVTPGH